MALQVQAPTRRPRQGGIKTVIEGGAFIPVDRLAVVNQAGGLAWESSGCGLPKTTRAGCYDDVIGDAPKTFDGISQFTTIGDPFARYAGVECYLGDDEESYLDQARTLLDQGEDRSIESVLWNWAAAAPTPGTGATYAEAIGKVEDHADVNYVGAPIILMSRVAADLAYAEGVLEREDGRLVTANGNWVLATGSAVDDQNTRIIAIGGLAVYASSEVRAAAMLLHENLGAAIAERVYAIGVDCDFRYAVDVDTTP